MVKTKKVKMYCLKCRKQTDQKFVEQTKTKNGRLQNVFECSHCKLRNRRFIKSK